MKKTFLTIILLISFYGFACTCPPIVKLAKIQKAEIENSEYIFIGEVIEVNKSNLTFKIKVSESLDGGDNIGKIYRGKNWKYCSPFVSQTGKWIVYGHMENGFLRLNMCGISRDFKSPIVTPLAPSPKLYEKQLSEKAKQKLIEKIQAENMRIALSDLDLEITALRKRRDNE